MRRTSQQFRPLQLGLRLAGRVVSLLLAMTPGMMAQPDNGESDDGQRCFECRGGQPAPQPPLAPAVTIIYPQVFHLDPDNAARITISNPQSVPGSFSIRCHTRAGEVVVEESQDLNAFETVSVQPEAPFVGSCLIEGSIVSNATWNIVVNQNTSRVGVAPIPVNNSPAWSFAVGTVSSGSLLGLAIHNRGELPAFCIASFRQADGVTLADESFQIGANGQISQFLSGLPETEIEGQLNLDCDQPVLPVVVFQDLANGFPTPIFGEAAPEQ